MKKNKSKKNHKVNRYNGRNVYGQRCIAKTVTLEKETALEQYLDILDDVEAHKRKGETLEYMRTSIRTSPSRPPADGSLSPAE